MPLSVHKVGDHMDPDQSYSGGPGPPEHLAVLGGFLGHCAEFESATHKCLRNLSTLDDRLARILVGHMRADDLLLVAVRLAKARELPDALIKRVSAIRTHQRYVQAIRNIVAHQSPDWRTDWVRFHSFETARDLSDPEALLYVAKLEEFVNLSAFIRDLSYSIAITGLDATFEIQSVDHYASACLTFERLQLPPSAAR